MEKNLEQIYLDKYEKDEFSDEDYIRLYDTVFEYLKILSTNNKKFSKSITLLSGKTVKYVSYEKTGKIQGADIGFQNELVAHIDDKDLMGLNLKTDKDIIKFMKQVNHKDIISALIVAI